MLSLEVATESYRFRGLLSLDLVSRRLVDVLNEARPAGLTLSPVRYRRTGRTIWTDRELVEIPIAAITWVGPGNQIAEGRPEYRVKKVGRRVGLIVPPEEIDATIHVASDTPDHDPLAGVHRSFFVATDAVVRRGNRVEDWPLLLINRQAIHGAWLLRAAA